MDQGNSASSPPLGTHYAEEIRSSTESCTQQVDCIHRFIWNHQGRRSASQNSTRWSLKASSYNTTEQSTYITDRSAFSLIYTPQWRSTYSCTHSVGILDHRRQGTCQVIYFQMCDLYKVSGSTCLTTDGATTHGQGHPIITFHSYWDRLRRANQHKLMERSWIQNLQMLDLYICASQHQLFT